MLGFGSILSAIGLNREKKPYDVQVVKRTGQILRIQEHGDILTPWGLSDNKGPLKVTTKKLTAKQACKVAKKALARGRSEVWRGLDA